MKQFFYGVKDHDGVRRSGIIEADNTGQALATLRGRFPLVLRLDPVGGDSWSWRTLFSRHRVTQDEVVAVTQQLASILEAGLSFGAALDILLLDRVHRRPVREVLVDIAASINEGNSFSQSLRGHPTVFSEMYVGLVEAGENSAQLPEVLERLAEFMEKSLRLRMDILSATIYPLLVLIVGFLVATTTLLYGAPMIRQMYRAAGAELPWMSRIFIEGGSWLAGLKGWLLLAAVGLAVAGYRLWQSPTARERIEQWALAFGPFRELVLETAVARCCRTLATLYGSGVPVLNALRMTARGAGNPALGRLFHRVADEVASGRPLSEPLLASSLFPPMAAGMITAGEASGTLPSMLEKVADYYERRVDFALKSVAKLIEPFLILGVGGLIGSVVVALGLPFMNLVAVLN
ncbi:MAG: type II secretion system F family protein [Candidatus Eremiobacteraeota bacterium]|nr:type II secretion system F family protein [Candidatus Eremiobacteraeota bacterium]